MHVFVLICIILDFKPCAPQYAINKQPPPHPHPPYSLSVFLEQTTDDKPLGILRATHPERVQVSEVVQHEERRFLIKARPSWVDSELSDMSANASPVNCQLQILI